MHEPHRRCSVFVFLRYYFCHMEVSSEKVGRVSVNVTSILHAAAPDLLDTSSCSISVRGKRPSCQRRSRHRKVTPSP